MLFAHPGAAIAQAFRTLRTRLVGQPRHLRRANEEISGEIKQRVDETKDAAAGLNDLARIGIRQAAQARRAACQVIRRLEKSRVDRNDSS